LATLERDSDLQDAACEATQQVAACRLATQADPASAERAMRSGMALAKAGDLDAAETELSRAIDLDPSLKHAYLELWTLYDRRRKYSQMEAVAKRFLEWNPDNVVFRVLLRDFLKTKNF
jgi:tetratricopeptide (TPR) repeat protein